MELEASSDARLAAVARNDSSMKIIPSLRDRDRRSLGIQGESLRIGKIKRGEGGLNEGVVEGPLHRIWFMRR